MRPPVVKGKELHVPIRVVVSLTPQMQAAGSTLQVERVEITPSLPTYNPLLHHIALVLQAVIEGERAEWESPR